MTPARCQALDEVISAPHGHAVQVRNLLPA